MKKITCPYPWDCGKTFKPQELSEFDFDFIQSAIKKKMAFMIIHCPKCTRQFKLDPVQWKADEFGFSNPNVLIKERKKTKKQLTSILDKAKARIPAHYFTYLTSGKFNSEISIFANEDKFTLYDLNELCEKINVDEKSYLTIRQLKGFASTLKEFIKETPKKKSGTQFTLTELSNCLAIGYEDTRILFMDSRDNNSLWIFHSDGGYDIEKTRMTLEKIIRRRK